MATIQRFIATRSELLRVCWASLKKSCGLAIMKPKHFTSFHTGLKMLKKPQGVGQGLNSA